LIADGADIVIIPTFCMTSTPGFTHTSYSNFNANNCRDPPRRLPRIPPPQP
jgi:hypothetical protein